MCTSGVATEECLIYFSGVTLSYNSTTDVVDASLANGISVKVKNYKKTLYLQILIPTEDKGEWVPFKKYL